MGLLTYAQFLTTAQFKSNMIYYYIINVHTASKHIIITHLYNIIIYMKSVFCLEWDVKKRSDVREKKSQHGRETKHTQKTRIPQMLGILSKCSPCSIQCSKTVKSNLPWVSRILWVSLCLRHVHTVATPCPLCLESHRASSNTSCWQTNHRFWTLRSMIQECGDMSNTGNM